MADPSHTTAADLERALLDPGSVFSSPRALVESTELTTAQKIAILHRWAYEAAEMSVAVEEGMPDGDDDLQRQIQLELLGLKATVDTEHTGPTKHHGIPE